LIGNIAVMEYRAMKVGPLPPDRWPPPPRSFVHEAWGVALSGPGAATALLEHIAGHAEARGVPIDLTTSAPENLP
jgi:hypothetical protein